MNIEPYVITSGILQVVCQRLVRTLCECAQPIANTNQFLGMTVKSAKTEIGCKLCQNTGFVGRMVLTESMTMESPLVGRAVLSRSDRAMIASSAKSAGMRLLENNAVAAVENGWTSPREIRRVLGLRSFEEQPKP